MHAESYKNQEEEKIGQAESLFSVNLPENKFFNPELEGKRKEYLRLLGLEFVPDCIVVLDAGVAERKIGKLRRWDPTSYEDETANWREQVSPPQSSYEPRKSGRGNVVIGAAGGKARAIAGAELFKYFQVPLVTTSKNSEEQKADTNAKDPWEAYKDYLVERQNIPQEMIISEKESTSTFEQVVGLVELAQDKNWRSMLVILNDHHLPRTKKFFEYLTNKEIAGTKLKYLLAKLPESLRERIGCEIQGSPENPVIYFPSDAFFKQANKLKIFFGSAEDIIIKRDPRYAKVIDEMQKLPAFRKRLEAERRGLDQLQSGEYGKPRKT